jgi:hypothetical protein
VKEIRNCDYNDKLGDMWDKAIVASLSAERGPEPFYRMAGQSKKMVAEWLSFK